LETALRFLVSQFLILNSKLFRAFRLPLVAVGLSNVQTFHKRLHYTRRCHLRGRWRGDFHFPIARAALSHAPFLPAHAPSPRPVVRRARPTLRPIGLVRGYRDAAPPGLATIKDATM